jgi:hypothetical protein
MSAHYFVKRFTVHAAITLTILLSSQIHSHAEDITIPYDLDANGPETSTVEECGRLSPCFHYTILGQIQKTHGSERPFLINIYSIILVPPNVPTPYSPLLWNQPELFFVGEYLSDALSADVSMRFYLDPIVATFAPLPAYELFVNLTEGRSKLDLTGGYNSVLLGTLAPNSASFSVHGRAIPEPTCGMLLLVGAIGIIASRWHQ